MTSILTSPPATEPVTLAEAKAHLRIDDAGEDALIERLIVAARHHVEAVTGLALIAQGWSVFRDRWPDAPFVEVPMGPVIAIDEVRIYGEDDEAAVLDPAHYIMDRVSRPARLVLRNDRLWPPPGRKANGIEIKIEAGYGAEASDVPEPLRAAILRLAGWWFEHRGDEESIERAPLGVMLLLQPYRLVRL